MRMYGVARHWCVDSNDLTLGRFSISARRVFFELSTLGDSLCIQELKFGQRVRQGPMKDHQQCEKELRLWKEAQLLLYARSIFVIF